MVDYADRSQAFLAFDEFNRIPAQVILEVLPIFQEKLFKH
jgi:hypothetical protein